ncbi:MAG: response regulator transcription factor [Clostridiales bacterium]|nr:response regulator transcription factor [Clostridiales bacterium]
MYHIIICDKDLSFREEFYNLFEEVTDNLIMECCITQCKETEQVAEILKTKSVDLLFLSIELENGLGFEFGKHLRENLCNFDTQIVYVSEKPEYAMELFETMPLDFLLKPISKEKLQSLMEHFLIKIEPAERLFYFKVNGITNIVPYNEIFYFQSTLRKIVIFAVYDTNEFYGKLDNIEEQLPEYFVRIHKSYIVNTHFVTKYCYDSVSLSNKQHLPISRSYKEQVQAYLKKYVTM